MMGYGDGMFPEDPTPPDNVVQLHQEAQNDRCECGQEWVYAKIVVNSEGKVVARTVEGVCDSCGLERKLP